jgi:hypothetical protein
VNVPGQPDHAGPRPSFVARVRKAIAGALGIGAILVSAGQLDDTTEAIVSGIIAVATVAGIYGVRNAPEPAARG